VRAECPQLPHGLHRRIESAIRNAVEFLRGRQRADGSFPGFWGINFTYAIFHVVKGLRAAGIPSNDPVLSRAAEWLVSKQKPDGGWGEHHSGCLEERYVEHPQSQVVMTSWALLALMDVSGVDAEPVRRGIAWLTAQQRDDGSWPSQAPNGVFFGAAMLDYRLYKSYFPVWALARYVAG
jgi:lanosterol synthase